MDEILPVPQLFTSSEASLSSGLAGGAGVRDVKRFNNWSLSALSGHLEP